MQVFLLVKYNYNPCILQPTELSIFVLLSLHLSPTVVQSPLFFQTFSRELCCEVRLSFKLIFVHHVLFPKTTKVNPDSFLSLAVPESIKARVK